MSRSNSGWKPKLILLVGSCVVVIIILLIGEFICREFTTINFLDNSRGLFTADRFGTSFGNTPNFERISFGEPVRIDENGFRVALNYSDPQNSDRPALLILGDSVGFGPAVPEEKSIGAWLRTRMPDRRVYNASVIGYGTFDYLNAGKAIVDSHSEVNGVIILFCLNDVSDASAGNIRREITDPDHDDRPEDIYILRRINNYLRSRSKLYLWLKNLLRDTQMIYFRGALYSYQMGHAEIDKAVAPLVELKNYLQSRSIPLQVYISPNEAQLRPGAPAEFLDPQKLLAAEFRKQGINFVDLTPEFFESGLPSKQLFLYGDAMHFSAQGSAVAANAICATLADCKQ